MQIQSAQAGSPFDIIYNARSSRASRSRKSSIHVLEKDKPRPANKKARKMTMNPQSLNYQTIREIEELHEAKAARSERGDMDQQHPLDIEHFLELGGPRKIQSEKQLELESGICFGIGNQRELDSDFNLSRPLEGFEMDLEIHS